MCRQALPECRLVSSVVLFVCCFPLFCHNCRCGRMCGLRPQLSKHDRIISLRLFSRISIEFRWETFLRRYFFGPELHNNQKKFIWNIKIRFALPFSVCLISNHPRSGVDAAKFETKCSEQLLCRCGWVCDKQRGLWPDLHQRARLLPVWLSSWIHTDIRPTYLWRYSSK